MGDLVDNAIKSAPGTAMQETVVRVKEQKEEVMHYCRDLDEQIIGFIQGNHEERSYREDDFDVSEWFANETGVQYFGAGTKVNLELKGAVNHKLTLLVAHTYRGANPINKCRNFYNARGPADIVALAHMHEPFVAQEFYQDAPRIYIQTGTYQQYSRFFMENTMSSSKVMQPAVAVLEGTNVPFMDFNDAIKILEK
jgi:hypothetical protein